MITTLLRPDSGEEALGLLAETVAATVMDARVVEDIAAAAPADEDAEARFAARLGRARDDRERAKVEADIATHAARSPHEVARAAWRRILPDVDSEWLVFRTTYGWTVEEVDAVVRLLHLVEVELRRLAPHALSQRPTLVRDAGKVRDLALRWGDLLRDAR